jgi:hypothetical protein
MLENNKIIENASTNSEGFQQLFILSKKVG